MNILRVFCVHPSWIGRDDHYIIMKRVVEFVSSKRNIQEPRVYRCPDPSCDKKVVIEI